MVSVRKPNMDDFFSPRCVQVNGPIIVGAGLTGLAVGSSLKEKGVPCVILERADCMIASLWQQRTYDRLKLHLQKQFCHLPNMPFPAHYHETFQSARYDETSGLWRVRAVKSGSCGGYRTAEVEYLSRWLVDATVENAEQIKPELLEGLGDFCGPVLSHVSEYKLSGETSTYRGKKVPQWRQETDFFKKDGFPNNNWPKGKSGRSVCSWFHKERSSCRHRPPLRLNQPYKMVVTQKKKGDKKAK